MAILFPGELQAPERGVKIDQQHANLQGGAGQNMGMLGVIMDLNGQKRILINDGSNDRILIGFQSGGF